MDQLPRLVKRELICLLLLPVIMWFLFGNLSAVVTCNYVVSVWSGLLWVLGIEYVILLWHSLSLPYTYMHVTPLWLCCVDKTCKGTLKSLPVHPF